MRRLIGIGVFIAPFQGARHAVAHVEVGDAHVRRQEQLKRDVNFKNSPTNQRKCSLKFPT